MEEKEKPSLFAPICQSDFVEPVGEVSHLAAKINIIRAITTKTDSLTREVRVLEMKRIGGRSDVGFKSRSGFKGNGGSSWNIRHS